MTKYSCFEHSQSNEAPVEVPVPGVLKTVIELLIGWNKEFTKRAI